MKRNNKSFVISMMASAVVGFIILMMAMFMGIKHYMGHDIKDTIQESCLKKEETLENVEYTTTILAVVTDITETGISAMDIENSVEFVKTIDRTTKFADAYGRTIPVSSIQKGDIVEVVYEENKECILSISKSNKAWIKEKVNGLKVSKEAQKVKLFDRAYTYDKNIVILNAKGEDVKIEDISAYDIVTVKGIDNKILSIYVERLSGSIKVINIPDHNGRLELDINKMIPLSELTMPIEVTAGKHKIVVSIKGYNDMIEEVEIAPGEVYELSLNSVDRAYTNVNIVMANSDVEDYTININNKTYTKDEKISLPQDIYTFKITAKDYKPWSKQVVLNKPNQTIKVVLKNDKPEEEENKEDTTSNDSTDQNNGTNSNTSSTSKGEANNTAATGETRTIDISTDPVGAKVYINGVNKGTTPYKATLTLGSYSILLEKEGYEVYSTSIILDGSDAQTGFLYVLTQNE
ncbi:PEGA domain-containing protein [Cellulosilyticum ruminicola]|uniref:PEGA domain-containing protein n=1 Tax=Cellulosilyticum ruminicola TaxID=425254 RepID=UPI0006D1B77B|nr:PEGA domain-containing protein [Cellulosilyticum ruminicola]